AAVPELDPVRCGDLVVEAGAPPRAEATELGERLWRPDPEGVPRFAPLTIGDGPPGLLAVLCRSQATGADNLVSAVASHAAVAVKHHDLVSRLREENVVKDFFEALARGDGDTESLESQAGRLGAHLDNP